MVVEPINDTAVEERDPDAGERTGDGREHDDFAATAGRALAFVPFGWQPAHGRPTARRRRSCEVTRPTSPATTPIRSPRRRHHRMPAAQYHRFALRFGNAGDDRLDLLASAFRHRLDEATTPRRERKRDLPPVHGRLAAGDEVLVDEPIAQAGQRRRVHAEDLGERTRILGPTAREHDQGSVLRERHLVGDTSEGTRRHRHQHARRSENGIGDVIDLVTGDRPLCLSS